MRRLGKVCTVGIVGVMVLAMCPAAAFGYGSTGSGNDPTWSKENPPSAAKNMKQRGCRFDLKVGKWKSFKSGIYGGQLSYKARVSKVTTKSVSGGRKQTKVTVQYKLAKNPTQAQGRKVAKRYWMYGDLDDNAGITGGVALHVVDYATGENLRYRDNTKDVKCKLKWKNTKQTKKYRYKDAWCTFFKSGTAAVTATYPKSFKDLSICFGAPSKRVFHQGDSDEDDAWLWYKTDNFKRDIGNYHFMRIG